MGIWTKKETMINRILPIPFIVLAVYQWIIIGERTKHALWMWLKFRDYGGGGATDIRLDTLGVGVLVSLGAIFTALSARNRIQKENESLSGRLLKLAAVMLIGGLIWLALLLLSPFAYVVK